MKTWSRVLSILLVSSAAAPPAHAGLADALKKKISDKASQTVDKKLDKAVEPTDKKTETSKPSSEEATPSKSGSGSGSVSSVSTKFDFVPGDNVLFMDDFTGDELGEFPSRWSLVEGTFEVAEMDGKRWARCVSFTGAVKMKVPPKLPEFWTLEFDFLNEDPGAIALTVEGVATDGSVAWRTMYPYSGQNLSFVAGSTTSDTPFPGTAQGLHHVAFMARGTALKVYVDRERMANMPDVTVAGTATEISIRLGSSSKPMITNVRFAEGCKPAKDMLATGKLVTQGIRFATASDVVMPESAPILRQIASYMGSNPAVRLKITGHTDNVGAPAANSDLSKRRAAAVAKVLSTEFGVDAGRFETDGKGDTQAIASNAKPEGRAMNRRVEFAKL